MAFETDIGPVAAAQVGAQAYARGVYVDGTLLTDILDDDTEAELRDFAASISMPVGPVLAMRPWLAASTISVGALAAEGFNAQGVEFVLQPELTADRSGFLESGEEQLEVLAGAPEEEQVAMLVSTLTEMDSLPKVIDKMLNHWLDGTPDELSELFTSEMSGYGGAFAERLLYARNQNWMAPIETMLADNEENLIVVGAAHLIGDRSVLDLLEKAGYEVERIQ